MIRYGVAMYGLNPSGHALAEVYPLQPALELVSELIQVKELSAGEACRLWKNLYDFSFRMDRNCTNRLRRWLVTENARFLIISGGKLL